MWQPAAFDGSGLADAPKRAYELQFDSLPSTGIIYTPPKVHSVCVCIPLGAGGYACSNWGALLPLRCAKSKSAVAHAWRHPSQTFTHLHPAFRTHAPTPTRSHPTTTHPPTPTQPPTPTPTHTYAHAHFSSAVLGPRCVHSAIGGPAHAGLLRLPRPGEQGCTAPPRPEDDPVFLLEKRGMCARRKVRARLCLGQLLQLRAANLSFLEEIYPPATIARAHFHEIAGERFFSWCGYATDAAHAVRACALRARTDTERGGVQRCSWGARRGGK